jgi:hypothetical protein
LISAREHDLEMSNMQASTKRTSEWKACIKDPHFELLIFFSTSFITCHLQRSSIYIEMHGPGIHSRFNEFPTLQSLKFSNLGP